MPSDELNVESTENTKAANRSDRPALFSDDPRRSREHADRSSLERDDA
jgi:hypothetical protein